MTLDEQDRALWDGAEIEEGLRLVDRALMLVAGVGSYQLQAAIAAIHASATRAEDTDWRQIAALYRELELRAPSPVITLNRAVAVAMSHDVDDGLAIIDRLAASGELENYALHHAARAELLRRAGRFAEALGAYERALALTTNAVERRYIRRRIAECSRPCDQQDHEADDRKEDERGTSAAGALRRISV